MPGWRPKPKPAPKSRHKGIYIGAPACFALEQACQHLTKAFGVYGCYVVGSCLVRPDWRDIDLRYILPDDAFRVLFPDAHLWPDGEGGAWEQDPRWLLLTVTIAAWLKQQTGLPIDFQFQPQSHANALHSGPRSSIGKLIPRSPPDPSPV